MGSYAIVNADVVRQVWGRAKTGSLKSSPWRKAAWVCSRNEYNLHTWNSVVSTAGIYYRLPEHNLKVFKWPFLGLCREIGIPCYSDKSHLVELLHDCEVSLDVFWHFMEFNTQLTHIVEDSAEKQTRFNQPFTFSNAAQMKLPLE